jgi:radical SAM superfamily enzyme YgiQ (UPF0313 family)
VPDIVLATLNARFSHAALGLRYLYANLGELRARAAIREFTIHDRPALVVERLLLDDPRIIGLGVYIWNLRETTQVVAILRQVAPHIRIVVGGPEVSHDSIDEPIVRAADVLITGEADLTFAQVCRDLLAEQPVEHHIRSAKPDLTALELPYAYYSADDLAHRLIYVEASRGCPYTCEFCLSSVENGVRSYALDRFLLAMDDLLTRGCRTFKFVDRTFNLSPRSACAILEFFLERIAGCVGLFLHFEMVPDRLPDAIKALISRFPAGALQFEVGIQSFTPVVGELVSRRMDRGKTEANLLWLRDHSKVHVHADLIIGLPGETMDTLDQSFAALWYLRPQEIQVGILKLLKGTPIARHCEPFAMLFSREPPYELLASRDFSFAIMQRLKRFARYFELFANSQRFAGGLDLVMSLTSSPFLSFLAFSDWLWQTTGQEHAINQARQYELLAGFLDAHAIADPAQVRCVLAADFMRHGQAKYLPEMLRPAAAQSTVASSR